jgi:sirohydrochlorin ferrochelatase
MHRLLLAAHGTASAAGSATTARLTAALAAARPSVPVALCFLDVVTPLLADALDDSPTIVVPLLLTTGYHVQSDIPAAVADHPATRVAGHLGPDPLLAEVLAERVPPTGRSTVLVAVGSRRPEATAELATAADLLAALIDAPVHVHTLGGALRPALASLPAPVRVATYLLAEGQFLTMLHRAAGGIATVAEPLGVHAKLVELIWARYDAAVAGTEPVDFAGFPAR